MATKKASADDKDSKVFDVASPSEAKPTTGSKPMVIGHKSMASDPTIKSDAETEENTDEEKDAAKTPSKKIVLQPLSSTETDAQETDEKTDGVEKTSVSDEAAEDKKKPSEKDSEKEPTADEEPKTKEEVAEEKQNVADEKEQRLQELIKSGEYAISIKENSNSVARTYITTFVVVGIFGVVLLAVLADLDLIELGFNLPFDIL